jgi:hypothetical protein
MSPRTTPRNARGAVPGKQFVDTGDPYGIKVGVITRVDEVNMKADIRILTGGGGERSEVELTQGGAGPRSFWGGVPEVNSLVIVGYRRRHKNLHEAVILGYLPVANKVGMRFDPLAPGDPAEVSPEEAEVYKQVMGPTYRRKRLMLRPGEYGGMSAEGAEFALTRDVRMVNRAGDLFELRDSERTLVAQSVHRVEGECGVRRVSGPIRRSAFYLPPDIFKADGKTLKDEAERYFGRDEMQDAGPGNVPGGSTKFANMGGKVLDMFNDTTAFPQVIYANGRRVHYVPTNPATNMEDSEQSFGAEAFVEHRMEMSHTSDLQQEVLEEIDGVQLDRRMVYIEQVFGTTVGNNMMDALGQRQYAKVLKPKIFDEFWITRKGKFSMEECVRQPNEDYEVRTMAGAYLFRMNPPGPGATENPFAVAVSKQGKLFVNVPGSKAENFARTTNVSAEVNLEGALKAFIGAAKPDGVSVHITCEGAFILDTGHVTGDPGGQGFELRSHSGFKITADGGGADDNSALDLVVQGVRNDVTTGAHISQVQGSKSTTVNGAYQVLADRMQQHALQGFAGNYGDLSTTVSGKTVQNYAQLYQETIVTGGKLATILAGAYATNVAAGAMTYNVLGGASTFNNAAGAFTISVGTGAIAAQTGAGAVTISTAAGAMSLAAGAGAISITAGLALNILSGVVVSLSAPQILLGGPAAVLGVSRGLPMMPPGVPSLDWVTGSPLQGCAVVRSI